MLRSDDAASRPPSGIRIPLRVQQQACIVVSVWEAAQCMWETIRRHRFDARNHKNAVVQAISRNSVLMIMFGVRMRGQRRRGVQTKADGGVGREVVSLDKCWKCECTSVLFVRWMICSKVCARWCDGLRGRATSYSFSCRETHTLIVFCCTSQGNLADDVGASSRYGS